VKAFVFIGPTLSTRDAQERLDAVYLPPVRQGDLYRVAAFNRPDVIGIVDGSFQQTLSVWHKEIMWAMSQGIHVFGSASMGALRAAELADFGMVGTGRIFKAYRSGFLAPYDGEIFEDDDEVAVLHGPPETGYVAVSEALVNIRCTLARAERETVIAAGTRDALVGIGKAMFYQKRAYEPILALAESAGLPAGELAALREWLPQGMASQKREDAIGMLEAMRALGPEPKTTTFEFQDTSLWRAVVAGARPYDDTDALVLDELRLEGTPFIKASQNAVLRLLSSGSSGNGQRREAGKPRGKLSDRLRAGLEATDAEWLERILARKVLAPEQFDRLIALEGRLHALELLAKQLPDALIDHCILDMVRMSGDYGRLRTRALDKQRTVAGGKNPPTPSADDLIAWHFGEKGGNPPEDVRTYAGRLRFAGMTAFLDALLREYIYRKTAGMATGPAHDG
jgi:hypothetical protein